jgi:cytochrome c553
MMRDLCAVALGLLLAVPATAAEAPPGAVMCSGCHHEDGMAVINGRSVKYLVSTMEAFRSGDRPATLMNRLVKGFSPEEVQAIAEWIAAQK